MRIPLKPRSAGVSICRLAAMAVFVCIAALPPKAHAIDISQTILVERYTILPDGDIEDDEGYLLKNGKYEVITSLEEPPFGIPLEEYEPISGRPIMLEEEFDDYKAAGVIPHWTRSA